MTDKTITESEFQVANAAFADMYGTSAPASLRAAFGAIGFTIAPAPIPEPLNGEIVVDDSDDIWRRDDSRAIWVCMTDVLAARDWKCLVEDYGPLDIYAKVGS